jgi:F0F1-type ATP synthase gamma subunit
MILSPLQLRARRAASLLQVYQDAARSTELRAQEVASVTDKVLTLLADRGVEQSVLAAAVAEQAARTRLAAQASSNAAAARANLVTGEPAVL